MTQHSMVSALGLQWRAAPWPVRAAYVVGALLLLSGAAHLALLLATGASWQGPVSLRKPATFGLSFGLTLVTLAWVIGFVRLGSRVRTGLVLALIVASVLETLLVSLQAWRGVPSHFNVATPFDAWVTRGLAGGGVALVAMIVMLTIASFRRNPEIPTSVRLAVQAGFITLCAAMVTGAAMIARGMTLVFRDDPATAYLTGGLWKPMHAITMHGILVLPALAWLLTFTAVPEPQRIAIVRVAIAAYIVLIGIVATGNLIGVI